MMESLDNVTLCLNFTEAMLNGFFWEFNVGITRQAANVMRVVTLHDVWVMLSPASSGVLWHVAHHHNGFLNPEVMNVHMHIPIMVSDFNSLHVWYPLPTMLDSMADPLFYSGQ